jgi:hypothetical protein
MPYFYVKEVLSAAINIIDNYGYAASKTSKNPTWKLVTEYVYSHVKKPVEDDDSINHISVRFNDESLQIIKWVKSLPDKAYKHSSYMSNAREVIGRGYCGKNLFGLVVALIPIYRERKAKL